MLGHQVAAMDLVGHVTTDELAGHYGSGFRKSLTKLITDTTVEYVVTGYGKDDIRYSGKFLDRAIAVYNGIEAKKD